MEGSGGPWLRDDGNFSLIRQLKVMPIHFPIHFCSLFVECFQC